MKPISYNQETGRYGKDLYQVGPHRVQLFHHPQR